jgi:phosphatidylserine/phosphatidylglycerophosphate/cardiolipin synthase-like enzyme
MPVESDPTSCETASSTPTIFESGANCWRIDWADRFSCVQDAADYFRLVRHAILHARDTIFILGWDIQSTLDLVPGGVSDGAPTRLDELLKWVIRRRPQLACHVLIWDYAALYALERDPLAGWRLGWQMPKQVRFAFDDRHPIGGSHHQKIVVVDDVLAFCGGIDLTGHRWDTTAHRVDEPARCNAAGSPYGPYHEIQAMVCGPVAASLGTLARRRWQALGETTPSVAPGSLGSLWPDALEPDVTDIDVAIARTFAPSESEPAIRECERLFFDSIAAARQSIYIESQYFTNDALGRALAARLQEPEGPEILVVIPKECHGWVEKETMGALRDEVLRHLIAADRWRRLRVVFPAASRARDVPTFVHSKVMIVDDRFARIGSANLSRRSMGVDSECDLAIDAGSDRAHRAGVQRIRDRLIGEHLGVSGDAVTREVRRVGSLRGLVDARADADRTLLRVDLVGPAEPPSEVLKAAADPDEPLGVVADTSYRRIRKRVRLLGVALYSLWPVRLSSLLSTRSARRRREGAEFG